MKRGERNFAARLTNVSVAQNAEFAKPCFTSAVLDMLGPKRTLADPDGAAAQLLPKDKEASCSTMNGAPPEPHLNCFAAASKALAG